VDPVMDFESQRINLDINTDQANAIAFIVNSDAYMTFYKPFLEGMLRGFYHDLAAPARERHNAKPDDYCRGGIMVINALLSFPENAIQELQEREQADARQKAEEQHYADRAASGEIGPAGIPHEDEDY